MTVSLAAGGMIELSGVCGVEDAEALLQRLSMDPTAKVEWTQCESAHSAVIQVLLLARVEPVGTPAGRFLKDHVGPLLRKRSLWFTQS